MLSYYPQLDLIKVNCTPDFLCNAEMSLTCCLPFSAISRMEKQVNRRRVEHDAFTAALVTPNVSLRHSHDQLSISELKPNAKTGRNLLSSDPSSITTCATYMSSSLPN